MNNELREITNVFVDSFGGAEEAALVGQQWGQLDPSLYEDGDDSDDDDEEIKYYESNQWNEKVTGGVEEVKDPEDGGNNYMMNIYNGRKRQRQYTQRRISSSRLTDMENNAGSPLYYAKELLPFLWTVAKGFVPQTIPSAPNETTNEVEETDEVFIGSFDRAEEAALAGQQWGQLDPSLYEEDDDDDDDEEIEYYESISDESRSSYGNSTNQRKEEVTVGVEELEDGDNSRSYDTTTVLESPHHQQKQQQEQKQQQMVLSQETKTAALSQPNSMDAHEDYDGNHDDHRDNDNDGSRSSCSNITNQHEEVTVEVKEVEDGNINRNNHISTMLDGHQHPHQTPQQQKNSLQEAKSTTLQQSNAKDNHSVNDDNYYDHSNKVYDNDGSRSSCNNSTHQDIINNGLSTRSRNDESCTEITTEYLEIDLVTSVEEEQMEEQEYITNHDLLESQSQHSIRR